MSFRIAVLVLLIQLAFLTSQAGTAPAEPEKYTCPIGKPNVLRAADRCDGESTSHGLYINSNHSIEGIWKNGADWQSGTATFLEKEDGTAILKGGLKKDNGHWAVKVEFSGRQWTSKGLNPFTRNQGNCDDFNSDSWYFYTNLMGVLTEVNTGKQYKIEIDPMHPAQVGTFANVKNSKFGISFWMTIHDYTGKVAHADVNSDIECGTLTKCALTPPSGPPSGPPSRLP